MASVLVSLLLAHKRRYPQSGSRAADLTIWGTHDLVQRSSSAMSTTNKGTIHNSSLRRRRSLEEDMNLVGTARDAKDRLDKKLRTKRISNVRRTNDKDIERLGCVKGGSLLPRDMQMEVFGSKKRSILSRLCHKKFQHKVCAICLEGFKAGETLLHLQCSHRFHLECLNELNPWLENNAHCPHCRMPINSVIWAKK